MGARVQGFPVLLASVVKEVTSLPGIPSLSPLLEEASGAALGAADGSPFPAGTKILFMYKNLYIGDLDPRYSNVYDFE